jgi:cytoskeletal protein CcmA (bactofilin family)
METPKAPDAACGEMIIIGQSIVIKGELSCGEDLYIDGRVEGTIDPKGNRLTIGPNGRVKANVTACVVVVQGKLEGNIQASDRVFNLDASGARDTWYHPSSLTNQSIASSRVLNLQNSRWEKVFSAS